MPRIIYGTAWKKEKTASLVERAVTEGFRGVDTACQPRHYREDLVGAAIKSLESKGIVRREDLFLQTKYTPPAGQDPDSIPYNPRASIPAQVRESFSTSLRNLGTEYIDSLVLHSPLNTEENTLAAWGAMEEIKLQGKVKQLGISNCYDLSLLRALYEKAKVKPAVVQNRFYLESGYDKELRKWCADRNILYQSFWTLTANPFILSNPSVRKLSSKYGCTEPQVFFKYLIEKGIVPLTGTCDPLHMKQDLDVLRNENFEFEDEELADMDSLLDHVISLSLRQS